MASGPCLRRCLVVRRYMPIKLQFYRLDVKAYPLIHVSMCFEPFWEGNAVNTGVPCLKVPMHRKLGYGERGPEKTYAPAPLLCRAGLWPPRAPGVELEAENALSAAPDARSCCRGA